MPPDRQTQIEGRQTNLIRPGQIGSENLCSLNTPCVRSRLSGVHPEPASPPSKSGPGNGMKDWIWQIQYSGLRNISFLGSNFTFRFCFVFVVFFSCFLLFDSISGFVLFLFLFLHSKIILLAGAFGVEYNGRGLRHGIGNLKRATSALSMFRQGQTQTQRARKSLSGYNEEDLLLKNRKRAKTKLVETRSVFECIIL